MAQISQERFENLRRDNAIAAAAKYGVAEMASQLDRSYFLCRIAALKRGEFPSLAPPPVILEQPKAPGGTDSSSSTALMVMPAESLSRRRQREEPIVSFDESPAASIVGIDPSVLREQTRQAQLARDGVATAPVTHNQPRWKMAKILTGHHGWVRCLAVDPSNKFFCTGSNDCKIKAWDLATGKCRQDLVGHKETVRGLALSALSPHLYSCSDDHSVKCWDLERNEMARDFHGHKGAVHTIAAHPAIDLIITGSRDKTVHIWDVRSRQPVHVLKGHTGPVLTVAAQGADPQVMSAGDDTVIFLWDLRKGEASTRLTRHSCPVRSIVSHHSENVLLSCGADNIRKWNLSSGEFMTNMNLATVSPGASNTSVWTSLAISHHNAVCSGSADGKLCFMDWESNTAFQSAKTKLMPGTLEAEGEVFCVAFDVSGTRLISGVGDKTVKIWNRQEPS